MAANQLDQVDLAGVAVGGQIREDLMQKIFDVSPIDLPFTDAVGREDSEAHYKEWVREALETANKDNARIDGSSSSGINNTVTGERLGNYHQIATKTVRLSDRARKVRGIESTDELIRQLMKRQKALRRDVEASAVSRNVAVAGDGSATASKSAGVGAWIGTGQASPNSNRGATGADPILSGNPGGYPTTAAVAGTKRALSEATIKSMHREAYLKGGNPSIAMSVPAVIEKLSDYLLTSTAKVATIQTYADQKNMIRAGSGNGLTGGGVSAQGSVNLFITPWGVLELCPNRFQPDSASGAADLYLLDPDYWAMSYLQGYETKTLAREGLGENREISVDYTLVSMAEEASAVVADIDYTLAATA